MSTFFEVQLERLKAHANEIEGLTEEQFNFAINYPTSVLVNYVLKKCNDEEREKLENDFFQNGLLSDRVDAIKIIVESSNIKNAQEYEDNANNAYKKFKEKFPDLFI